ncbi:MAG: mannose-1-phosphate guanylyltransferase [Paraprevotella sp.]|nr:mannose-1-phosphate guanylyltransferase [Paraprevotella sp.]
MDTINREYCVILAGGIGSRLWPVSRKEKPKQFLDFFGCGYTLLQQTHKRFAQFIDPSHIYISTNAEYVDLVKEQLPDISPEQILAEPVRRSTLPSIAWATLHISRLCPDANIVVTPADQLIVDEEAFVQDITNGLKFVSSCHGLLTMGVRPSRPDVGYGYIQVGEAVEGMDIYKVKSFTEKPAIDFARMFVESGEFYWNTGLFLWNARTMMQTIRELVPDMGEIAERASSEEDRNANEAPDYFSVLPNLSLDYSILERSRDVYVQVCNFGWTDFGNWHSMYDDVPRDAEGNVLFRTKALMYDSKENVVCLPDGRVAVIAGLQGYVIAEEGNVLMICPKGDAAAMRRIVTDAQMKLGEDDFS